MTKKKLLLVLAMLFLACSVASAQTPGNQNAAHSGCPSAPLSGWRLLPAFAVWGRQGGGQRGGRHGAQSGRRQGYPVSHVDRLAFIETLALYTMLIIFMKVK